MQDLRSAAGKPARAPPFGARVCAPRPPARPWRLLAGTAARSAGYSALSSANAGLGPGCHHGCSPRAGEGLVGKPAGRARWVRADPLQLQGLGATHQRVGVLGGAPLEKPQVLCSWGDSGSGTVPAGRAQVVRGGSEIGAICRRVGSAGESKATWGRGARAGQCTGLASLPIVSAGPPLCPRAGSWRRGSGGCAPCDWQTLQRPRPCPAPARLCHF